VGFRSEYGGSSEDDDDDAYCNSEDGGKLLILGVVPAPDFCGLRVNVANGYMLFFAACLRAGAADA
jgi:hypothetical protein